MDWSNIGRREVKFAIVITLVLTLGGLSIVDLGASMTAGTVKVLDGDEYVTDAVADDGERRYSEQITLVLNQSLVPETTAVRVRDGDREIAAVRVIPGTPPTAEFEYETQPDGNYTAVLLDDSGNVTGEATLCHEKWRVRPWLLGNDGLCPGPPP